MTHGEAERVALQTMKDGFLGRTIVDISFRKEYVRFTFDSGGFFEFQRCLNIEVSSAKLANFKRKLAPVVTLQ